MIVVTVVIPIVVVVTLLSQKLKDRMRIHKLRSQILQSELTEWKSTWNINFKDIKMRERIDKGCEGSFGQVWLADWQDMMVAVKYLHSHWQDDKQSAIEFQKVM